MNALLDRYAQAHGVIKQTVLNLIKQGYRKVFITGHSLGGALAELAAMDASEYTKGLGVTVEVRQLHSLASCCSISVWADDQLWCAISGG